MGKTQEMKKLNFKVENTLEMKKINFNGKMDAKNIINFLNLKNLFSPEKVFNVYMKYLLLPIVEIKSKYENNLLAINEYQQKFILD